MKKKILPIIALSGYAATLLTYAVMNGQLEVANEKVLTLKKIQGEVIEKNANLQYELDHFKCPSEIKLTKDTRIDIQYVPIENVPDGLFRKVASNYQNVDAGFAYAVFLFETDRGNSDVWRNQNNPAGIIKTDGSGEYKTYETQEAGLYAMFDLIQYYSVNGRNTPQLLRDVWSETEDTDEIVKIWNEVKEYGV